MIKLVREYKVTLARVEKARRNATEHDKPILGNVSTGLRYSIDFMETGCAPGVKHGISRLQEIPWDPQDYKFISMVALEKKEINSLSQSQREMLDDLLDILTARECEAFKLVRGQGYSFEQARVVMKQKSKGAVQTLVARAEKKLKFVVRFAPNSKSNISKKNQLQRVMFSEYSSVSQRQFG